MIDFKKTLQLMNDEFEWNKWIQSKTSKEIDDFFLSEDNQLFATTVLERSVSNDRNKHYLLRLLDLLNKGSSESRSVVLRSNVLKEVLSQLIHYPENEKLFADFLNLVSKDNAILEEKKKINLVDAFVSTVDRIVPVFEELLMKSRQDKLAIFLGAQNVYNLSIADVVAVLSATYKKDTALHSEIDNKVDNFIKMVWADSSLGWTFIKNIWKKDPQLFNESSKNSILFLAAVRHDPTDFLELFEQCIRTNAFDHVEALKRSFLKKNYRDQTVFHAIAAHHHELLPRLVHQAKIMGLSLQSIFTEKDKDGNTVFNYVTGPLIQSSTWKPASGEEVWKDLLLSMTSLDLEKMSKPPEGIEERKKILREVLNLASNDPQLWAKASQFFSNKKTVFEQKNQKNTEKYQNPIQDATLPPRKG